MMLSRPPAPRAHIISDEDQNAAGCEAVSKDIELDKLLTDYDVKCKAKIGVEEMLARPPQS